MRLAVHGGFLQVDTSPGAAEGLAEGDDRCRASTRVTVLAGMAELADGDRRAAGRAGPRRGDAARRASSERAAVRRRRRAERGLALADAEGALARAELRAAVAADSAAA